ncbi:unnamed protein product [Rotaria magnacalcarata]|uniref:UMOD/GP2/OIT3-like D8C domain-containing protein n=1 Tax=Rotaria magnacalcarata TaxID=392030 RepID=A0A819CJ75_9BILA|nr:unnamed protein product [Rotaria magnacalcarata]CAF3808995.1 unnamed protein product [Rotaria magnacalcarata]CAF4006957.1 unnamed protein product [Rotaria magnacalcarata]
MSLGGLCTDTVISCNDLTPCASDNTTCTTPNTVCVNNTRYITYKSTIGCDSTVFGTVGAWIRFLSPAGTIIPTFAPNSWSCRTPAPGWYNGFYPLSTGSTIKGTVCYNWSGDACIWSNSIGITNCNTFYVFRLTDPPYCSLRYCAA